VYGHTGTVRTWRALTLPDGLDEEERTVLLRQESADGVSVLTVAGLVTGHDAAGLTAAVDAALSEQGTGVVVDLQHVTELAPDAVRALRELAGRHHRLQADLCLCGAPPAVERVLVDLVVPRTRQEAVTHLRAAHAGERQVVPIEHSVHGPAQARRAVAECAARLGLCEEQEEDLLLVVSEMVTNAVRHGAPPVELEVLADDHTVVLCVADSGPGQPESRTAGPEAEGGRGLALVDVLSTEHGVRAQPPGKAVWAAVRRRPEALGS